MIRSYLNLEVVNKKVKIYVVDEINEKRDSNAISSSYGVKRSIIAYKTISKRKNTFGKCKPINIKGKEEKITVYFYLF